MYRLGKDDEWIDYWNNSIENNPLNKRKIRTEEEINEKIHEKSKEFIKNPKNSENDEFKQMREETIDILKKDGVLQKSMEIIDIGAGSAAYTIPFSKIAEKVHAIESSKIMYDFIQDNLKQNGCNNVEVHNIEWEEIDLDKKCWNNRFDLSFASMCPGVFKPEHFLKFMKSSKKWCFLSAIGNNSFPEAFVDLWQIFFSEELSYNSIDIFFPFSLIYSMGYKPKLWFYEHIIEKDYSVEDAVTTFKKFMWKYSEGTPQEVDMIREYVVKKSSGGIYHLRRKFSQGMMYWEV